MRLGVLAEPSPSAGVAGLATDAAVGWIASLFGLGAGCRWRRIILDEAHEIKNAKSNSTRPAVPAPAQGAESPAGLSVCPDNTHCLKPSGLAIACRSAPASPVGQSRRSTRSLHPVRAVLFRRGARACRCSPLGCSILHNSPGPGRSKQRRALRTPVARRPSMRLCVCLLTPASRVPARSHPTQGAPWYKRARRARLRVPN